MTAPDPRDLLDGFVAGTLSADEQRVIQDALAGDPELRRELRFRKGAPGDSALPFLLQLLIPERWPTFALVGAAVFSLLALGLFYFVGQEAEPMTPPSPRVMRPPDGVLAGQAPFATGASRISEPGPPVPSPSLAGPGVPSVSPDQPGAQPARGPVAPPKKTKAFKSKGQSTGTGIREVRGGAAADAEVYVADFEDPDPGKSDPVAGDSLDGGGAMDLLVAPEDVGLDDAAVAAEMEADVGAAAIELAPGLQASEAANATSLPLSAILGLKSKVETRGWVWREKRSRSGVGKDIELIVPTDEIPVALDVIRVEGLLEGVQGVFGSGDGNSVIRLLFADPA